MTAATAAAVHPLWTERINNGNLDGLLALYEADAAYVTAPRTSVTGTAAVREALMGLLALLPTVTLEPLMVVEGNGVALLISRWSLTGTGPDGKPVVFGGQTADVVRQQADGNWQFAVDNPFGDAAAGS